MVLLGFVRAICKLDHSRKNGSLTLIYVLVPTKVFAIELMSSPETPKSQILISPFVFAKMLEGLISTNQLGSEVDSGADLGE